ncbi:MAG: hypothetical protein QM445_00445, partial [Thermotogota bacterium]|nr:hypothetical protein [Thermotogota bacterium]
SKSPLERGGPLAVGCVLFSEDGEPVTVDLRGFLRISVSFITNLTGFFSLSSLVSAANLSRTLFLNGLSLPGVAGAGLAEGETGHRR